MKAFIVSDKTGFYSCFSLVFAETAGKAKVQARYSNGTMYQSELDEVDFLDMSVVRAKDFDNMENESEKEICLKLIKDYSWWFEVNNQRYDEDNIKEFERLWR